MPITGKKDGQMVQQGWSSQSFSSNVEESVGVAPWGSPLLLAPAGATAVTFDRSLMGSPSFPANSHSTLYVRALAIPGGTPVNNISFVTGGTIIQIGGSHGWYCLLDQNRVVQAVTLDQTGATTWSPANTKITLPVSSYVTTYTGLYYVGFCTTSTTEPSFFASAAYSTVPSIIPPILMGSITTGYTTTPPAVGTTLGTVGGNAFFNYLAWTS